MSSHRTDMTRILLVFEHNNQTAYETITILAFTKPITNIKDVSIQKLGMSIQPKGEDVTHQ